MRINSTNQHLARKLVNKIRRETPTIGDGEGVAMFMLWTFLLEHAQCQGLNVEELAKQQVEAFIEYARDNLKYVNAH